MKEAPFSRAVRREFEEIIVHTGQHYDENMSRIFFEDMGIPKPKYNLNIGSGMHGLQTARILEGVEGILLLEKPDYVVVFGDTNSTLAGALAAVKLHIPVGHIEAGLRSFNRRMPEEINRIMTDSISSQLFCPTGNAADLLAREGIVKNVHVAGDVMYDAIRHFLPLASEKSKILQTLRLNPGEFNLLTIHRAENTDDPERLKSIFRGVAASTLPVIFPRHPRLKAMLEAPDFHDFIKGISCLHIIEPVGFLDMLMLESAAFKILTDSGGVQKEAFFMKKPCITLRDETEWTETVEEGYNRVCGADEQKITDAVRDFHPQHEPAIRFGDGHAAEKMATLIDHFLSKS